MRNSSKNENDINPIDYADQHGITVYYGEIPLCESMSVCKGETCYIAIDPLCIRSMADGRVKAAHEVGHCETGSFYARSSPADVRGRHEYRADKWAVHYLIPPDKLQEALNDGYTDTWELAEQFDVTEEFVQRAVYIYQCEGLLSA